MSDLDVFVALCPADEAFDPDVKAQMRARLAEVAGLRDPSSVGPDAMHLVTIRAQEPHGHPKVRRWALSVSVAAVLVVGIVAVGRSPDERPRSSAAPPSTLDEATIESSDPSPDADGGAAESVGVLAPLDLPPDLVVWSIRQATSAAVARPPFVEQLFGRYRPDGSLDAAVWLRVQSEPDDVQPDPSFGTVEIRGTVGVLLPPDSGRMLRWTENRRQIDAVVKGMPLEAAITMLDEMTWRENSAAGLDPASAPDDLALIDEDDSTAPPSWPMITYLITAPGGPGGNRDLSGAVARIDVGRRGFGDLRPWQLLEGIRSDDGSVVVRMGIGSTMLISPDGVQTLISVPSRHELAPTLMASIRAAGPGELAALVQSVSSRLEELPELSRSATNAGTVLLRGQDADRPSAMCVVLSVASRCAPLLGGDAGSMSFLIGRHWLVGGAQSPSAPAPVALRWGPDGAGAPVATAATTPQLGGEVYWLVEIPEGVDDVTIGIPNLDGSVTPQWFGSAALRRPIA